MTSLPDVQRAIARICLDATPNKEDLALLHDPQERWLVYRKMVRSRLFAMARSGLPRTAEVLGKKRFDRSVARYLAERGPASRFIRDIVHELSEHALPGWESDESLPPHLGDLVRYEATKWRVATVPWESTPETSDELDFSGIPVFNPTVHTTTVRYRVDKQNEPLEQPHLVVVYRKAGDAKIYWYVLDPEGTALFSAWREPERSLADSVKAVLAASRREPSAGFVDGMAGVLADLVEQTIILGSRR